MNAVAKKEAERIKELALYLSEVVDRHSAALPKSVKNELTDGLHIVASKAAKIAVTCFG